MKIIKKFYLPFIIFTIIIYLCASLSELSFNVIFWEKNLRTSISMFYVLISLFFILAITFLNDIEND